MAEENGKPEGQKPFVVSFEREDDPNDPITGDRIVGVVHSVSELHGSCSRSRLYCRFSGHRGCGGWREGE